MDLKSQSETLNQPEVSQVEQEVTSDETADNTTNNRRNFLTRAAIGAVGTAGLMALGASETRADTKSKILERIRAQMAQEDVQQLAEAGGDSGIYGKSTHGNYLKA